MPSVSNAVCLGILSSMAFVTTLFASLPIALVCSIVIFTLDVSLLFQSQETKKVTFLFTAVLSWTAAVAQFIQAILIRRSVFPSEVVCTLCNGHPGDGTFLCEELNYLTLNVIGVLLFCLMTCVRKECGKGIESDCDSSATTTTRAGEQPTTMGNVAVSSGSAERSETDVTTIWKSAKEEGDGDPSLI